MSISPTPCESICLHGTSDSTGDGQMLTCADKDEPSASAGTVDVNSNSLVVSNAEPQRAVSKSQSFYQAVKCSGLNLKELRRAKLDTLSSAMKKLKLNDSEANQESDKLKQGSESKRKKMVKYTRIKCTFKMNPTENFEAHLFSHVKHNTLYKCKQCNYTSIRQSHLQKHEVIHSLLIKECALCDYKTDDEKLLLKHNRDKHVSSHFPRPAGSVNPVISSLLNVPCKIEYDKTSEAKKLYCCKSCSYKAPSKELYSLHWRKEHLEKNYLCFVCFKAFQQVRSLIQHLETHEATSSNPEFNHDAALEHYTCNFTIAENKVGHTVEETLVCKLCGKVSKDKYSQKLHNTLVHNIAGLYTCKSCPSCFSTLHAMKLHLGAHAEKKNALTEVSETDTTDALAEEMKDISIENSKKSPNWLEEGAGWDDNPSLPPDPDVERKPLPLLFPYKVTLEKPCL